jgi:cytochrome P450
VFGFYEGLRYQELKELFGSMLDVVNSPKGSSLRFLKFLRKDLSPWSPWGQFVRLQQQIDQLLYDQIQERREHPDPESILTLLAHILSLLIAARYEAGQPMSDADLHDEWMTMLVAGHETTSTALAWALYSIHHVPGVIEKLLKELDSLGDNPNSSAITQIPNIGISVAKTCLASIISKASRSESTL